MDEKRAYRLAAEDHISTAEAVKLILDPYFLSELIVPKDQPEQIES